MVRSFYLDTRLRGAVLSQLEHIELECVEREHQRRRRPDNCGWRVSLAAANLLTAALERRVESLQRAGATALVVDITGNGGGSDWWSRPRAC